MPWRSPKPSREQRRSEMTVAKRNPSAGKGLWLEAYDELRGRNDDLVSAFEKILASSSASEALTPSSKDKEQHVPTEAQLNDLVNDKLSYMNERQWRISLGNKSIEVRTQVDRILKIVTVAKDFGSSLASLDPIHAGLPWAGVCLLLRVCSPQKVLVGILTIAI